MRRITCLVFAAAVVLAAGSSEAKRGSPLRGAIRSMERNVTRLAKTSIGDRNFTALQGRRGAIWLRPQSNVIVVGTGLRKTGFRINRSGTLSFGDRLRLARAIKRIQPGASGRDVSTSLRSEVVRHRAHVKQLKSTAPTVNRLLKAAARVSGDKDVTIWRKGSASVTYRPMANVLVGNSGGFSQQGFFLSRTNKGLQVQSHHEQPLQQFLLGTR